MALYANVNTLYVGEKTEFDQYWKVSDVAISYEQKRATIQVCGYTSEKASKSVDHKGVRIRPLDRKIITIKDENLFDEYFGIKSLSRSNKNPLESAYEYLKTHIRDFKESIDA